MSESMIVSSLILLVFLGFVFVYNSLIFRKNGIDQSFGAIQTYLKKRSDLIPNLVALTKNFSEHEKKLLTQITALREKSISTNLPDEERVKQSDELSSLVKKFMLSIENYPELQSNENYLDLQITLLDIENQLSAARQSYNAAVVYYNNGVEMIPHRIVAKLMGLEKRDVIETKNDEHAIKSINEQFEKHIAGG